MALRGLLLVVFVVLAAAMLNVYFTKRVTIPSHMLNNPSVFMENLLTEEQGDILMDLAKDMKEFPVNTADLKVVFLFFLNSFLLL